MKYVEINELLMELDVIRDRVFIFLEIKIKCSLPVYNFTKNIFFPASSSLYINKN